MLLINGYLMSKDVKIARIIDNVVQPLVEKLLPLYIKRGGSLLDWLASRSVDRTRTNARLLKKVLKLTTAEDYEVAMKVYGSVITDVYWVLPDGLELSYKDVKFSENPFGNLMLKGDPEVFSKEGVH